MTALARILVVATILIVLVPVVAGACPLCKDAKSDADYAGGSASLPSGFYYSILFMVTAPFAVLGALVLRIVLARRKLRGADRAEPARGSDTAPVSQPLVPESSGARP